MGEAVSQRSPTPCVAKSSRQNPSDVSFWKKQVPCPPATSYGHRLTRTPFQVSAQSFLHISTGLEPEVFSLEGSSLAGSGTFPVALLPQLSLLHAETACFLTLQRRGRALPPRSQRDSLCDDNRAPLSTPITSRPTPMPAYPSVAQPPRVKLCTQFARMGHPSQP